MSTVYVCPERDIECGRNPSSWCDKCPQLKGAAGLDEEPSWAFKNPEAPGDLKLGDYVFASRWGDSDPGDPWAVGYVESISTVWVTLEGSSRHWPRASRITEAQGARIIAEYPPKENSRGGIPYAFIRSIFPRAEGCDKCGISGIHACPGVPLPPPSAASIQNLNDVLSEYAPIPITMRAISDEELESIKQQLKDHLVMGSRLTAGPVVAGYGISVNQGSFTPFSSPHKEKAQAFDAIKAALEDPNQDGVLAKIRRVVSSIKD